MFHQPGQQSFTEPNAAAPRLPSTRWARSEGKVSPPGPLGLPSFLSPEPPRSEGEALLRRIFSRGEVM
jgi:hypothetical protein